jgi:hypothetical protein
VQDWNKGLPEAAVFFSLLKLSGKLAKANAGYSRRTLPGWPLITSAPLSTAPVAAAVLMLLLLKNRRVMKIDRHSLFPACVLLKRMFEFRSVI